MFDDKNYTVTSLSSGEVTKIEEFRKSKQTAILAILFSDIVNSTFAAEKLGEEAYSKLRHIHDELFKKIVCRDNAGIIIKEIGDSFLCVFAEPSTAVLRALEFQHGIKLNSDHLTTQNFTLTVRIGIHVGQVAVENSLALDIFGRHVNRAARIESFANGGQILTSLAVWENAVGWIKDSNHDKIGWISHGKTKLKGVEERVEIFEFYSKNFRKPLSPAFVGKRRQRQMLWFFLMFVLLLGSFFIIKHATKQNFTPQSGRKAYYVQFDFSEISKQLKNGSSRASFDTIEMNNRLLSQSISAFSPDSVVTEADLIKFFSKRGELYQRHSTSITYNIDDSGDDHKYFRDTLKLAGVIMMELSSLSNIEKDSFLFNLKAVIFASSTTLETSTANSDRDNIEYDFRSMIQGLFETQRLSLIQGYILTCNDNEIIFKLNSNSKLQQGTSIRINRNYSGKAGLYDRLTYLKTKMDYFKSHSLDSVELKSISSEYDRIESLIPKTDSINNNAYSLDVRGRITELYDSTGKATWKVKGKYLLERPKPGDAIYISN